MAGKAIGIKKIKYRGLEVEFRDTFDVSTDIGHMEMWFYKALVNSISLSNDTPVTLEVGNNQYVSYAGSAQFETLTQGASKWNLSPVSEQPNTQLILTADLNYRWKFDVTKLSVTLELHSLRSVNATNWFKIDPSNTSGIVPFIDQSFYIIDNSAASSNNNTPYSHLYASQNNTDSNIVRVDDATLCKPLTLHSSCGAEPSHHAT